MQNAQRQSKVPSEWRRYVAFSFASSDLLIELAADSQIQFVTGATAELLGAEARALMGRKFIDLVDRADRATISEAIAGLRPGHRLPQHTISFTLGRTPFHLTGFRLPDDPDRVYLAGSRALIADPRVLGIARDGETGLLSRSDFTALVEDQIELLSSAGEDAALTLLQVDDLEGLRRRVGPTRANALLRDVGDALRTFSIGGDTAGRLDDEKYGIVHQPMQSVTALVTRLTDLIRKTDPSGKSGVVRQTISLSEHGLDGREAAQAIRYAVNRFVDADANEFDIRNLEDGLEREMSDTVERIRVLKRTIAADSFTLVFQPIVAFADRIIKHHEALTRFANGGSPHETIVFAESVGMVADFDLAVARKVRDFVRDTSRGAPVRIAVNLSARSLESDLFVDALRALMAEEPALRPAILFEVTESYKVKELERANTIIQRLRGDGHKLCLDDFGAGGASFDYIQVLDVDVVKLDGIYVRRMLESQRDSFILEAMAALCRKLRIETVAEFVETEDQAHRLHALGVRYGQGWLFGKPLPVPATQVPRPASAAEALGRRPVQRKGEQVTWA